MQALFFDGENELWPILVARECALMVLFLIQAYFASDDGLTFARLD